MLTFSLCNFENQVMKFIFIYYEDQIDFKISKD